MPLKKIKASTKTGNMKKRLSGNKSQENLTGDPFYKKSKPKASGLRGRTKRKF
tara:strand:+ start:65 stop:223 length:159 start_codon:yes stop_codon:yes gene_type:complete